DRLWRTVQLYSFTAIVMAPLVIWHLFVGGVQYFHYHPYGWFPVKYAPIVGPEFWGNGLDVGHFEYARIQFNVLTSLVMEAWVFALVGAGILFVRRRFGLRGAIFCVSCIILQFTLILLTRPSAHARYFYPLLPLLVLLAAGGLFWMSSVLASVLRDSSLTGAGLGFGRRHVMILASLFVGSVSLISAPSAPSDAHHYFVERPERDMALRDIRALAPLIDGTTGGVIARDSAVQHFLPDNQVFTHFLLSEEDYVTYLSWRSDQSVVEMLTRNGIEWVLIRNNRLRWEHDYNVWLEHAYGVPPLHYVRVDRSPAFDEVYSDYAYRLYRLKPEAVRSISSER
ncbi:MAG: hypothetical protein WEB52_02540, partial [Dehalococcoidia bacterium]